MKNVEQGSSEVVESTETESSETHGQAGAEAQAGGEETEGQEGQQATESEAAEGEEIELTEKDGKKFIPYERFQQINERLKKSEEAANFLEAIKTDPVARQEFVKALGLDAEKSGDSEAEEPAIDAPFQKFLDASVDPAHHGHYSAMANAIEAVLDAKYIKMLKSEINPIINALGGLKLESVRKTIPDFAKYEEEAAKIMKKYPGMPPEEAYTLASSKDTFKKGVTKGASITKLQQGKINKAPITKGSPGAGSQGAKAPARTFREAFDRAAAQIG